ncbi:tRNA uracil 4-sulfurtransferase ThiI [Desertibacillus haloalkaliphilus]|uniref:tRNA uracil 4-sulfurtransferase ThiI n=1 Tax=Desertibacillus haloalkaliphilus TaxID=1328930 RepID=UPI001C25AAF7|nr:tRNA uracil 4-sulfurtransferase ThiI [Desertibacillus haloalkaliphilus]MBU8905198.1 tRNA 4-thiouridine(8) synthase ThiI [Desertibacillus haloalkaliphilus]
MKYDHILIRYGEIALKGKNRSEFERKLQKNIKAVIKPFPNCKVRRTFGRMFIELNDEPHEPIIDRVKDVFGVQSLSLALKVENEIEQIQEGALWALQASGADAKTFKVNARRAYKPFPINSQELNPLIGGHILKNLNHLSVDVHHPDVEVKVEVREGATYISCGTIAGAGGLPVGTSGKVMLMLSGGIDSPVAGYLAMKRGAALEAIHFHSPPYTNERAKQKVEDLTKILATFGGTIRLHVVPFTNLQKHIHEKVPSNFEMTIMRRMMYRISEAIATKEQALAIVNGESLGQVASQTLESMHTINEVTTLPILRPLITMDKVEVIDIAHKIGTYETSILPFEDCCTIFLPPDSKTKPKREHANKFEQYVDYDSYIDEAVAGTEVIEISANQTVDKSFEELF